VTGLDDVRTSRPELAQLDARVRAALAAASAVVRRSLTALRRGSAPLFLLCFAGYLIAGLLLVIRGGFVVGDAWSRVGNAAWMIISRDPHLAAVGFVWNPLPSLMTLPFVALRGLWEPLVGLGFAANIVSAGFMAGAAVVMAWIAADLGVRRRVAAVLVALFALNPMILLYGANGLSEAPFIFFLLLAVRYLLVWWRAGTTFPLAATGIALALAYLTRYEAVAAAGGALVAIALRAYMKSDGAWRARAPWVAADMLVAGLPIGFAFAGWAAASLIITGNPFETFTSVYGNSSQVALTGSSIAVVTGRGFDALLYALGQIAGLAPALPVLIGLAALVATRRRSLDFIVPLAIFGSVLAFAIAATIGGASFAWLRFSITAIPLAIVVAMLALAPRSARQPTTAGPETAPEAASSRWPVLGRRGIGATLSVALSVAVVSLVASSLPTSLSAMTNPRIGREEGDQLRAIARGYDPTIGSVKMVQVGAAAARYLDNLALPDGSVIVDVAIGFPIVLQSSNPRQFVITPDRDFQQILADPATFDVPYLLVPSGSGYASLDAIGRAYPMLFTDGSGFAHLVAQFGSDVFSWRLYRLD
jgi:hypothetical protein